MALACNILSILLNHTKLQPYKVQESLSATSPSPRIRSSFVSKYGLTLIDWFGGVLLLFSSHRLVVLNLQTNEGRHAQCDLHTTTDVVLRPELNAKCSVPFSAGVSPKCCASDFTLIEIKSLCGKMDSSGSIDGTPEEYVYGGTADWRTDLYQYSCPVIPTHKESIELIKSFNGKFTPELKSADVEMPYEGT